MFQAESLKQKTVKGAGWSFLDNIASSGITFLVGLILARLLSPTEYGIMAIITIFTAISSSIVDSGFSNALIRKKNIRRIDYNTVFYFNLIVSISLYLLLFFCSPLIAQFFKEPALVKVMRVMGIVLIINALCIIPRTVFVKAVDFKTQTKVSLISSLSSGVVGIGMAFTGFGIWALVGQQLTRQGLNTLFLWIYCWWRPVLEFSQQSFKELFGFGSKLLLSGLLDTIWRNIYQLVIGRLYSPATLGQYERANQFNSIFSSNLTAVIQRVSYPVLSSIQDEKERLREGYRRVIKTTMLISTACIFGMAACARPMIMILIGEKWLPCVEFLQIICLSGVLYPLHALNLNILQVKGRSDLFLKLEIIKKIIGLVPIGIGIYYGITAMLWCSVVIGYLSLYINCYYSSPLINYSFIAQVKDVLPTFSVSIAVSLLMFSLTYLPITEILILTLQIIIGLFLAIIIYETIKLPEYIEVRNILFSAFSKLFK